MRDTSQRHYKIGYVSVRHQQKATLMTTHYSKHPSLHIKGNWLNELGFTTGQAVTITTKKGQLIIELAREIA
ncbi:SymE family type I addiction module toxin [Utexia brackfieldae]|uniref:SymE family type I addiction module toxin n=1 Tax=Utexia brackfieldae TaxID=3074108 RepID=UPI00370D5A78